MKTLAGGSLVPFNVSVLTCASQWFDLCLFSSNSKTLGIRCWAFQRALWKILSLLSYIADKVLNRLNKHFKRTQ